MGSPVSPQAPGLHQRIPQLVPSGTDLFAVSQPSRSAGRAPPSTGSDIRPGVRDRSPPTTEAARRPRKRPADHGSGRPTTEAAGRPRKRPAGQRRLAGEASVGVQAGNPEVDADQVEHQAAETEELNVSRALAPPAR